MDQVKEVVYHFKGDHFKGDHHFKGDEVEITATEGENRGYNGRRGTLVADGVIDSSGYLMVRLEIHGEMRDIFVHRLMIKLIKRAPGRGASGAP